MVLLCNVHELVEAVVVVDLCKDDSLELGRGLSAVEVEVAVGCMGDNLALSAVVEVVKHKNDNLEVMAGLDHI